MNRRVQTAADVPERIDDGDRGKPPEGFGRTDREGAGSTV
jgi:hypothetical protein